MSDDDSGARDESPDGETTGEEPRLRRRAPVKTGRAVILCSAVALVLAISGIRQRSHDEERLARWTEDQAVPTVALASPKRGGQTRELVLPGDLEAFDSASIHGQVSGYVRSWSKDIGARVRGGDILAVVDTPELDERISEAESGLNRARANQQLARVTAQRWNSLRASAAVSQQAADEKQSDASAKDADVRAAQANVDRLRALKSFANIVAPFDGVVTARNIDIGTLVKADASEQPALFTVADMRRMRVYVHVPESYSALIKEGMKATLQLPEYPDRRFQAEIQTTSHAIDRKSRSLLVELIADNPDGALSPGAFTRVRFQLPPDPNSVTIPASALVFRDNAVQVAILGADDRVALKPIRIVRDFGSEVEIAEGLSPDQRIVVSPQESIADGEEVRLAEPPKPTTPLIGQQGASVGPPATRRIAEMERGRAE